MADPDRLVADFESGLKKRGLKLTRQRRAIAEAFFATDDHVTLTDLLTRSKARLASIGYATVYRTVRLMVEQGLANEHKFSDNAEALFEPNIDGEHHDHLICVQCGRIVEFEDDVIEQRQEAIARTHGFEIEHHRMEIYVRCLPACERWRDPGVDAPGGRG